ncbi:MAG: WG repeat-containing protein [Caldilineaceae bacterium]|nr:WG repeat-containing protein [Caldilineaceae bacterium]
MMKGKFPLLFAMLVLLALWTMSTGMRLRASPLRQAGGALSAAALVNAEYRTQFTANRTVRLTDGVYEDPETGVHIALTDYFALGDLNGDGLADAAAILTATINHGAPFYDLVAVTAQEEGESAIGGLILLGEGVQITDLTIADGRITVAYLRPRRGDAEGNPTESVTQHFFSRRGMLVPEQTKSFGQLFPYRVGTHYGYINVLGEIVIAPQFALAGEFSEGMAAVSYDGRNTGFINQIGELVITPRFSYAGRFVQGLAIVGVRGVNADAPFLTTYIDRLGRFVLGEQRFLAAEPFREGLAAVSYDGQQYGYIDRQGQVVIGMQFTAAESFQEGLAAVQFGGQYGYIDRSGRFVIPPQFEAAKPFSQGLAAVVLGGKTGYINSRGDIVIEPTFDVGSDFQEGRALVTTGDRLTYIDPAGTVMVDIPGLTQGQPFVEGAAAVVIDGQSGYIDLQGNLLVAPQFTYAGNFERGLAVVESATTWGLLNSVGEVVLELERTPALAAFKLASAQTQVIDYLPSVPELTRTGACTSNSELLDLPTAWKCTTEDGDTYDPCLTAVDGETIVCAASPMEQEAGFQLSLTKPLPPVQVTATPPSPIWQLRTAAGDHCRVNRVNSLMIEDQPVTHVCADGMVLLGEIDQTNALWTIERGVLMNSAEGQLTLDERQSVEIVEAWVPVAPE